MTDRLTLADAALLDADHAAAGAYIGGLVVVQPAQRFDYQQVVSAVARGIAELPRFRQVVRRVPGNLALPVWVDDQDFDLAYHVRRSALPAPGGPEQLDELIGRLISRPLDAARPLWELYIVEGLTEGRVALITKSHESLLGGSGSGDIAAALLDDDAEVASDPPAPWMPAPAPSNADLLLGAVTELFGAPSGVIDAITLWGSGLRQMVAGGLDAGRDVAEVAVRSARRSQRSRLRAVGAGPRVFARADIDLATVKAIRRRQGTTVNDVILAIVTGALRSWLMAHGDPLAVGTGPVALAPVSVRSDDPGDGQVPSAVAPATVELPVVEANAVVRLHQVAFHTRKHADSGRLIGAPALLALGRLAPSALHTMGARVAGQLSRSRYDVLITNAPGPQRLLYAAGSEVAAMYPIVPLVRGHGIALGCTSYRGRVYFGVTADRTVIPDVPEFGRLISEATRELAEASAGTGSAGVAPEDRHENGSERT